MSKEEKTRKGYLNEVKQCVQMELQWYHCKQHVCCSISEQEIIGNHMEVFRKEINRNHIKKSRDIFFKW